MKKWMLWKNSEIFGSYRTIFNGYANGKPE